MELVGITLQAKGSKNLKANAALKGYDLSPMNKNFIECKQCFWQS